MSRKPKVAVLHAFFKGDCKGGGEKLMLQVRRQYEADLFVGGIDWEAWGPRAALEDRKFAGEIWLQEGFKFEYLHKDSRVPGWRQLKRQLYFWLSPKARQLMEYDVVIFSGNVGFVQRRLRKWIQRKRRGPKLIAYVHTPPRPFTDQFEERVKKIPRWLQGVARKFRKWLLEQYRRDQEAMDEVVANSQNIRGRLEKYTQVEAGRVIFPAVETDKFGYQGQSDFYLSYGRLEMTKRIPLIVEAFKQMPEKKLIIASGGPLKGWLQQKLAEEEIENIVYEGMVSQDRLEWLVGNCIAGVYIPVDEDAGMTPVEFMSAGKPVIGVADGGLKETIVERKTGVLLNKEVDLEELQRGVREMTPQKAAEMREACEQRAEKFSSQAFFEQLDEVVYGE